MLHILGDGRTTFQTILALGHREIPELLSVFRLPQYLLTFGVEEGYLTCGFLYDSLHLTSLYHYRVAFVGNRVAALCRSSLWYYHQRCRLYRKLIL